MISRATWYAGKYASKPEKWYWRYQKNTCSFSPLTPTSVLSVRVFVASAASQGGVGCKWDCLLSRKHWYYLETSSNGLKNFLKCRTVGLCMTHNRLLGCHVVRSTKPVHYIFPVFISPRDRRMPRDEKHLAKHPHYPDRWWTAYLVRSIAVHDSSCG